MNETPPSLDRLHDLAVPPEVPWWPPAPGWYVVMLVLALAILWTAYAAWKKWRATAYRRAALRELERVHDPAAIAEILRRTALAAATRQAVAGATGDDWIEWLCRHSPEPLPAEVRAQLTTGIYAPPGQADDTGELRRFAAAWIRRHQIPSVEAT